MCFKSKIMTNEEFAAAAWNAVKDEKDPEFVHCVAEHRQNLRTRAEAVVRTGVALDEATAGVFGRFETKVRELAFPPVEVAEVAPEAAAEPDKIDDYPETPEVAADEPTTETEAAEVAPVDFSTLKRAELDELAIAKGLDPSTFATKADVIEALEA